VRQIASLISRLLSHYWTAADREETRQAQIEDWIVDLRQFGAEAVARACGRWRITEHRRPTPADIVKLAIEERDLIAPENGEASPIRGGHFASYEAEDAYAREIGFASALARRDAIAASKQTMLDGDWNHPERSRERVPGFKSLAEALGVTATEEPPF
jgi:hypothetical protein